MSKATTVYPFLLTSAIHLISTTRLQTPFAATAAYPITDADIKIFGTHQPLTSYSGLSATILELASHAQTHIASTSNVSFPISTSGCYYPYTPKPLPRPALHTDCNYSSSVKADTTPSMDTFPVHKSQQTTGQDYPRSDLPRRRISNVPADRVADYLADSLRRCDRVRDPIYTSP